MYKRVKAPFCLSLLEVADGIYRLLTSQNGEIQKVLETNFTKKVNVKKQRPFDRSTAIFKLKSKTFACAQIYSKC